MSSGHGDGPPPAVALMQMVQGFMVAKALQAAAVLGIADLLAGGPRSVADLAAATSTHEQSLGRLLRALASRGIFSGDDAGRYDNTPLSEALRSDVSGSVRDYVIYAPHNGNVLAWTELDHVLRTGEPSFAKANGVDLWGYFAEHPAIEVAFNRAMTALTVGIIELIVDTCDFSRFKSIIDIGGGEGRLLAAILTANPGATGTLFDLPGAAEVARRYLETEGLAERTEVVAGDMFASIPSGHDAYVLKNILHDWSDEKSIDILRVCRQAMGPHSRLIILDAVMEPGNDPHPAKWFDLHMMVALGGRERSEDQFRTLLAASGFALRSAVALPIGVVEADPI
ncbi:MAG: methyltransferase [Actinobacteria bacterium]|nr:MAG: methyltransferase [Actinomycetota bacterium]